MARRDVEFDADGVTLRGWFYPTSSPTGVAPTIVLAHGYSAVKEMYLDRYAEHFAAEGLNALVYDHRNLGDSDGHPRQEIDPWQQVRDYRHAITYAGELAETDDRRIGIWGSSYSGGHVLVVAAIDRRVKAVVSQVPMVSGYDTLRSLVRSDFVSGFREMFDADRVTRFHGGDAGVVPAVAEDPLAPSAMPTPDSWTWFTETAAAMAPNWKNEVTMRSVEMLGEYNPIAYVEQIAPTPLLLMPGTDDVLTPTHLALAAYEKAREPKKITLLPGGHFDAYGPGFETSSASAAAWFAQHLSR